MNEIVVVGAGPSGASAAKAASEAGYDVLLIEEDQEIGEPVQCAGIVSERTIKKAGINEATLNKVRGAIIHSPNNEELKIDGGETKAHVVNRSVFDKKLVEEALDAGTTLSMKTKARDWDFETLIVKKKGFKERINPDVLIGASGVKSFVRKEVTNNNPSYFVPGAQVVLKNIDVRDTDFVELFLGENYAPGFFGWFIPINESKGRLGVCVKEKNPLFYLNNLRKKHPLVKKRYDGEEIEWNFGAVPIGYIDKTFFQKTLLVGDEAGLAKPTTGGGVLTGLISGELAGKTASLFLEKDKPLYL